MNYDLAFAFAQALSLTDWRAIHDSDKARPAIPFRGLLPEVWAQMQRLNADGYGIFAVINELDGQGRTNANVKSIRAHFVDLDNLSAAQNYEAAAVWSPAPSFAVQTSPGKFHLYWTVEPYSDVTRFTVVQRKLRQLFDGDRATIDPARVMRVPGTMHCKGEPRPVTCWGLPGYGQRYAVDTIDAALAHVQVFDSGGTRRPLGDPALAAPSLDWVRFTLSQIDPNQCDRLEWITLTSAVKQAAWSLADEATVREIWDVWCARYDKNDPAENDKQWRSIHDTEIGWPGLRRRVPTVLACEKLGMSVPVVAAVEIVPQPQSVGAAAVTAPVQVVSDAEILTADEQRVWFDGCVFVERFGEILTPGGRLMNATKFNGSFGGKLFIINSEGRTTNEAWQAALRSTLWTIPKVDHVRFLPHEPHGTVVTDELGRRGVNTYRPARIVSRPGDIGPFIRHMELLLPIESDRRILFDFLAHNARFPGHKIPWAPLIQSAEGAGKSVIKSVIDHVMGRIYTHSPNAQELVASGSKFNAWVRGKLFILVDEIRVDERRDMIEVLKPLISEPYIEIQAKGYDQEKDDNYSNWIFFSNYKDAIPAGQNARRWAIFYSALQTVRDLQDAGMGKEYFNTLFDWLRAGGYEFVAHWLLNYPIERGDIPMRAPDTSCSVDAERHSRGPLEQMVVEAVEDGAAGFRDGWASVVAVIARARALGLRVPSARAAENVLETLGYVYIGRAGRPYFAESATTRATLYALTPGRNVDDYGPAQGY